MSDFGCLFGNCEYDSRMQSGPEQLRDWMRRRGFTQADAARYLEFPEPTISNLLNNKDSLGLNRALHVERHTGIPVEAWTSELADADDTEPVAAGKRKIRK